MGLSSNALLHLTKSQERLRGILSEHFKVKYCVERINTSKGKWSAAVPMVSFCDIPLSEIKNHLDSYGNYGIGLSKDWRERKGLNPVLYLDEHSILGGELRELSQELLKGKRIEALETYSVAIVNFLRYSKNYQARLQRRSGEVIEHYRFSDEREWRFVPEATDARVIYTVRDYENDLKRKAIEKSIQHLRLDFDPNDISYIIIKDDSEISEFIDFIRSLNYRQGDYERILTKIITSNQIRTDF